MNHPIFSDESIGNISQLNKETSYIDIQSVIFPSGEYVFPRIVGSLYFEMEKEGQTHTLEISSFELPYHNFYTE